jgi:excisionase family DNA binding protein
MDHFLTVEETARLLHIGVTTLRVWKRLGKFPVRPVRLGRRLLWKREDIIAWAESYETPAAA